LSIVPDPVSPITPPLDAVKPGQGRLYAAEYADYLPNASGGGYLLLHRGKIGAGPLTTPRPKRAFHGPLGPYMNRFFSEMAARRSA
jgi:hypothetical protein